MALQDRRFVFATEERDDLRVKAQLARILGVANGLAAPKPADRSRGLTSTRVSGLRPLLDR
jgi:hypothetical protein